MNTPPPPPDTPPPKSPLSYPPGIANLHDLGIGSYVSKESRLRFLNRNGSFNVRRTGLPWMRSFNIFHALVMTSLPRLIVLIIVTYVLTNTFFATLYVLCGPGALGENTAPGLASRFAQAYFFSIQTLVTIGYGVLHPSTPAANLIVMVEALVGLFGFALGTGLMFARFSRPSARILFSDYAIIAPYHGIRALEFRIINMMTNNELIDVHAELTFSRLVPRADGTHERQFDPLPLERPKVTFFPLYWTIVHPIHKTSPLYGLTEQQLLESQAEFIILLRATEETFSQQVHSRSSYYAQEVVWGARFADMFIDPEQGILRVDLRKLNEIQPAELPEDEG